MPVVIENFPGAGGMPGSQRVEARQSGRLQFLLGPIGTHALNQSLYKHPLYNAATDFAPVALIAQDPMVLITRKDFPAGDLAQFIAYAKAQQSTCNSAPPAPAPPPISAACCSTR